MHDGLLFIFVALQKCYLIHRSMFKKPLGGSGLLECVKLFTLQTIYQPLKRKYFPCDESIPLM